MEFLDTFVSCEVYVKSATLLCEHLHSMFYFQNKEILVQLDELGKLDRIDHA